MTSSAPSAGLEILLGRCDEVRAEVFVRGAPSTRGTTARVSGTLTGPRRGRDTTLPATARLHPAAAGGMARATVTEPAYWTPELPNLYRLEATLERAGEPSATVDRLVGLRRLGIRGRSLWLDGHRWVPRGIVVRGGDVDRCKAAQLAAVITDPDEPTLARTDEIGVAVIALLSNSTPPDPHAITGSIATWAAHPSAVVTVLPPSIGLDTAAAIAAASHDVRSTQLLAAVVSGAAPPPGSIPPGIGLLVVALDTGATPHAAWRAGAALPLIARRGDDAPAVVSRGPCDALQASLAAWGTAGERDTLSWDWAGYVVG